MRLAALALLLACSAPPSREAVPGTASRPEAVPGTASASCPDVPWGGYGEPAECAEVAARVVAGADRGCSVDADCAMVGSHCGSHAIAAAHTEPYASWPAPCSHPLGGQCPQPCGAVCRDGCCELSNSGCE